VDDEPSVLDMQMELLSSLGAEVVGVGSGAEAIDALNHREFALIITDLKMPGIAGAELFRWVEANQPRAASQFIFVTGDTMAGETHGFLGEGRKRCLAKPFSLDQYVTTIKEVLHG
jgi:CheY-like chemotaxis protein